MKPKFDGDFSYNLAHPALIYQTFDSCFFFVSLLKICLYKILVNLVLLIAFILLIQPNNTNAQWNPRPPEPRPFCVSQYALANHACALLPYEPNPPPTPPPSPPNSPPPKSPPPKSPPPKSPPQKSPPPKSPPPNPLSLSPPHHRHGMPSAPSPHNIQVSESGHRHGHRSHHGGSPIEIECCRWLLQLDRECVCDLLVYLPVFLAKPVHIYTLEVGDACKVAYSCGSRIIGAESRNITGTDTKNVTSLY